MPTGITINSRRAFTLIEMLVVIAIVALLMGLLVPSLSTARRSAQCAVSGANLKQLAESHLAFAANQQDDLFNPFDPALALATGHEQWSDTVNFGEVSWGFNESHYASLMFSPHWASQLMNYFHRASLNSAVCFSPADSTVIARFRVMMAEVRAGLRGEAPLDNIIWDGSYWLAPAIWTSPDIWNGTSAPDFDPNVESGTRLWRHNRLEHCTSPQAKVMAWERFDFQKAARSTAVGREPHPPTWNNPGASPLVALMDGSAVRAKISDINSAITRDAGSGQAISSLSPCGTWNLPDSLLLSYGMLDDHLENGDKLAPGPYPAYFWATRDGIRGRDINR